MSRYATTPCKDCGDPIIFASVEQPDGTHRPIPLDPTLQVYHRLVEPDEGHAFRLFSDRLRKRWDAGAKQYGDASFLAPMADSCRQVMEELEDVPGWLFVLWMQARIAAGDVIDLQRRQDYEAEFLEAMRRDKPATNVVEQIAQMAGDGFHRWHYVRGRLFDIVQKLAQHELEKLRTKA